MNDNEFWALIDNTITNNQDTQSARLRIELSRLSEAQLISFEKTYRQKLATAYSWDLWAGAYIINGGCSDDSFDYFCDWLISRGETIFTQALKNPETLIGIATPWDTEFEDFRYIMGDVFQRKFGEEMPFSENVHPNVPTGDEWDEDTVELKYPKLAKWVNGETVESDHMESRVDMSSQPKKSFWQRLFGRK